MLNPLFCIMLMSESQSEQVFLHQLDAATRNKSSSAAIQSAITELLNDVDSVSISEPVKALAHFIHNYATESRTPLDTFVDSTIERYTGTFTDMILQKTPPRLSQFTVDELDSPVYRWLILFDQRFEVGKSKGLPVVQATLFASISAPIDENEAVTLVQEWFQGKYAGGMTFTQFLNQYLSSADCFDGDALTGKALDMIKRFKDRSFASVDDFIQAGKYNLSIHPLHVEKFEQAAHNTWGMAT